MKYEVRTKRGQTRGKQISQVHADTRREKQKRNYFTTENEENTETRNERSRWLGYAGSGLFPFTANDTN